MLVFWQTMDHSHEKGGSLDQSQTDIVPPSSNTSSMGASAFATRDTSLFQVALEPGTTELQVDTTTNKEARRLSRQLRAVSIMLPNAALPDLGDIAEEPSSSLSRGGGPVRSASWAVASPASPRLGKQASRRHTHAVAAGMTSIHAASSDDDDDDDVARFVQKLEDQGNGILEE